MRLFLYEFLCAGGVGEVPPSLRREGWAMLSALADDFGRVPDVEVWTCLDGACPRDLGRRCWRGDREDPSLFRWLASRADATLIIAPECDGILSARSQQVLNAGGRLLGSLPAGIDATADKRALAECWSRHGVPTPPCLPIDAFPDYPVVLKPRDGAGSQATFLIRTAADWTRCRDEARRELPTADFIVQPHVPGQPASVAVLVGKRQTISLMPAEQRLSEDGRFHYEGGRLPLAPPLAERAVRLAERAVACVAGLQGYVGVDLVLGADVEHDVAIEINPRMTTSYLGLRRLAVDNLAALLLACPRNEPLPPLSWRTDSVTFTVDSVE